MIRDGSDLGEYEKISFINKQNLKIQGYIWKAEIPKALLIFIHGITSHAKFEFLKHEKEVNNSLSANLSESSVPEKQENNDLRFLSYKGSWIESLNKSGITFCCYDQQGHGESEAWKNSRCNIEHYDTLAFDALQYSCLVNDKFNKENDKNNINNNESKLPMFIAGVSMGGGVCCRALELYRCIMKNKKIPESCTGSFTKFTPTNSKSILNVNAIEKLPLRGGLILCPNLTVSAYSNCMMLRTLTPVAYLAAQFTPTLKIGSLTQNIKFPWVEIDRKKDESLKGIYNDKIPAKSAYENLRVGPRVFADANLLFDDIGSRNLSLLIVHSNNDTLCNPVGSQFFYDIIKNNVQDVNLWRLDYLWHYLIIEDGTEELRDQVIEWINARC